jgi:hypothetical protein
MPIKLMRLLVLCTLTLTLAGCIFSSKPLFDIGKGATDLPVGLFLVKSSAEPDTKKAPFKLERHGSLYLYGDGEGKQQEKIILSFHSIGDAFYLVMAIQPGLPIRYGVLDARSKDKLMFSYLQCTHMPDAYIPQPHIFGNERCNATDGERLIAIANRYKADMMANRIEASRLYEYVPAS